MPPDHDENEECAKHAGKRGKGRVRKQESAKDCGGHAAEGEPAHDVPAKLVAIEPDAAGVADELGYREDGDRFAHAEHQDQHGQEHGGAAKAGDSSQQSCDECDEGQQGESDRLRHSSSDAAAAGVQARPANSPFSVDTFTRSPSLTKNGTLISRPVSRRAALVTSPRAVSPRAPGSV